MTMDFPTSKDEVTEMQKILDKMKRKWKKEPEPTLLERVHSNQIRMDWKNAKQMELKF